MPRPLRREIAGGLVHVVVRAVDRRLIFFDADDFRALERVLGRAVQRFAWSLHAYCVMGNHFHLVVDTPQPELSHGMKLINAVYARRHNARYGRRGHLVEDRFRSWLITSDAHYFRTIRYVVLNPVRAQICQAPHEWPWSTYRATAGMDAPSAFLDVGAVWQRFGTTPGAAQAEFKAFVADGVPARGA